MSAPPTNDTWLRRCLRVKKSRLNVRQVKVYVDDMLAASDYPPRPRT